jgi:hypothetical protein
MRESKKVNRKTAGAYSFVLMAAAALLSSCSSLPTSPVGGTTGSVPNTSASAESVTTVVWNTIASVWVDKGAVATVSGGRYTLSIVRGGLGAGTEVTMSEHDALVMDVIVGPESTVMSKAGTLTVSYAGTPSDLLANQLRLYRLNPTLDSWEQVAGTNDLAGHKYSAKVTKFGHYVLTTDPGKAGW